MNRRTAKPVAVILNERKSVILTGVLQFALLNRAALGLLFLEKIYRRFLSYMKHCPNCRTRYTDDTLRFCLQDGTPLAADAEQLPPTVAFGEAETETVISPRQVERLPVDAPQNYQTNRLQNPEIAHAPTETAALPRKSRTLPVILLTAFVTPCSVKSPDTVAV